jgi:hypothetical protein
MIEIPNRRVLGGRADLGVAIATGERFRILSDRPHTIGGVAKRVVVGETEGVEVRRLELRPVVGRHDERASTERTIDPSTEEAGSREPIVVDRGGAAS